MSGTQVEAQNVDHAFLDTNPPPPPPKSEYESIDVPKVYDSLLGVYEEYIYVDESRDKALKWVMEDVKAKAEGRLPSIVDMGCASGRPVLESIASNGIRAIGVDGSSGMIDLVRQNIQSKYPDLVEAHVGDMRKWTPSQPLDGIFASYSLPHLHLSDVKLCLRSWKDMVRPGGVMAASMLEGINGKGMWLGQEVCATSPANLEAFVELVREAGWIVEDSWREEWVSTARPEMAKVNLHVLARKRGDE